ncbi:FAS1-like dehydratase domain-containing protein [Amycolatopsis pithecellobii]|uniref:FAS1-like dehydratase domain-containing protein n=1 Tax=Amycolatopsis pithecellobii TaxID=664692 RepID=A0A6N7YVF2_9PSEU|nr:MaoC family dehydratase N-terminal domain-containing protein [Amycolatopsis pithecellobii]MTD57057.1 hypothetical protein [Amycolatopsis pithecellobii]
MTDSLSTAQETIAGQIGHPVELALGPVDAVSAQRFAMASADDNPLYFSAEAASAAGYSGIPVPPLYLSSMREWGPGTPGDRLQADGTTTSDVGRPDEPGLRVLGGGQRLEFKADVLVDMPLSATFEVLDVRRRDGRSGEMLVVEVSREYRTAAGEIAVVCHESRIVR